MFAFEEHAEWAAVKETVARLRSAGHEALLAGGCVRDLLLKRTPNDFDVATSATPDEVEALFPKSVAVGKHFGVIILPVDDFQIEVATFREDLKYRDGRRPEGVVFSTAEADAQRRDFTINALFYDLATNAIVDYVNGQKDLTARIIRTVGEPDRRFDEDKLRLLRAVRFAAQLDFAIDDKTLAAVKARASEVSIVSRERIRDELLKLLAATHRVRGLRLLESTGLLRAIFPDFPSTNDESFAAISRLPNPPVLAAALALVLEPLFGTLSEARFREEVLKGLKLENKLSEAVLFILRTRGVFAGTESIRDGEAALLLAKPAAEAALQFAVAKGVRDLDRFDRIRAQCFTAEGQLPKPFLTGEDLADLDVARGPMMGRLLNEAYLLQLEGTLASREAARDWVTAHKS